MAENELVLALDAGTQSIRALLIDFEGAIHGQVKTAVEPYFASQPGWAELDPEYYYRKLCETSKALFAKAGARAKDVVAVTLATQRMTFVNVDREGRPLRPAIVWLDQRKADTRTILPTAIRPALRVAGLHEFADFAVGYCRSNWIRQEQPEVWNATHKYLVLSGFLTHRLVGEFRDSSGNCMGTIPFDVKRGEWAAPWDFKQWLFPVEKEKLPELVRPTETLGWISRRASEETGIPEGLPMIAASNDKACEVVGAGCLGPETACISFGTTATINTQTSRYVELIPMMPPYPSAIPGEFCTEVSVLRGFWMVSWFKQEFGYEERMRAEAAGIAPEILLEQLIRDVPPGSQGLVLQPYWTPGPGHASYAKGSIVGFGDVHTRAHLYRAIVEGIVYALKEGAALTEQENGVPITSLRASGGGSQSDSIMQITADVFGLPVERPHTNETSALGAAMDAAVGLGRHPSVHAAAKAMSHTSRVFEPDAANVALYGALYEDVYRKMYDRLLPLYAAIQEITGYPRIGGR